MISCILPAYNEGPRIRRILELATTHPLIDEVIVVNDGSSDDTQSVIDEFPKVCSYIHLANQGKSAALHTGIMQAKGSILCFLDADLLGLTHENITALITPVLSEGIGMCISMRGNSPWIDQKLGIDYISGERVFYKTLLDGHLDEILALPHFGFEVFLNKIVIKNKTSLKIIFWKEVESPLPFNKYGFIKGLRSLTGMLRDMFQVISIFEVVGQFYHMRRLMVKSNNIKQ
jgi:glycosyltransferase involved in cell wall biosynthesis